MPAERNLTRIYSGDIYEHVLTFVDADEQPIDMTGTWRAQIRERPSDTSAAATFAIDTSDAATGVLVLSLTATQTAALPAICVWDLEETTAKRTYLYGKVRVRTQVSR